MMDKLIAAMCAIVIGLIALVIYASEQEAKEMQRQRGLFMGQCLAERAEYDCAMQWATYEAAHDAEQAAATAAGLAAAANANAAVRR